MGQIMIKGKPYHYDELELTYENSHVIDASAAERNLLDFKKVMDRCKVKFMIMHGTLLGAIREHAFIGHDLDVDTCTWQENRLLEAIPELERAGLKLCRADGLIYSFIRDGVYIDVYLVQKLQGLISPFYVRYCGHVIPRKYFRFPKKMEFLGEEFRIPNHVEDLLVFWYGKDWRIPKSGAPSNDEDPRGTELETSPRTRFLFRPIHKIIR